MSNLVKAKVLVVDDDASFSESIEALLEASDYHVTRARSRMSSLTTLLENRFDLILLDLNLGTGEFEGLRVIDGAKKAGIRVPPVIIVSGHPSASIKAAAAAVGTNLYLRKPFSADQLKSLIDDALETG